uniref:UDP-glucuronosyltransferase n=1 Tax=Mola mola TaxID=94237 RepID=A0A3Q4BPM5_MOLML
IVFAIKQCLFCTGITLAPPSFSGKLLVIPMDGSHWVAIKALAQAMGRRGHKVTVVIPEVNIRMGPGKHYDTVTFPVPYDKASLNIIGTNKHLMEKSSESFIQDMRKRFAHMQRIADFLHTTAESLLFNATLISHLAEQVSGFDAVLTDPMVPTGTLMARKLGLPSINLLRGIPCLMDMKAAGCPSPPSYVPRFFTGFTDKMNFMERTINTLVSTYCYVWMGRRHFDHIAYQFLGEEVGIAELLSDSAIWLQSLDFSRTSSLPSAQGGRDSWVSGEHGFVVFTLGSMVSDMPVKRASVFLEAFRQIPQKVIWRYTGQIPDSVPDNVRIMEWVPQNDLLAHPGARAFITHGGSHGLFEGLCHAVPMVMVPLTADQPDNAQKMASKGVGVVLDIMSITTEGLLQGLNAIINDTRYKERVQKLSAVHKDRPIDPLQLSVYWTEFVMRHKGAQHLRAAVLELNWIQYFCLDVIALLATVLLVFVILTVKCFKVCLRKLGRKRKQE